MVEQLGQEPDYDEMPPEISDFPIEVQEAFLLHTMMPDRWDGASGSYMGKDWVALEPLLNINEIEDKRICCFFLKHIESAHTMSVNEQVKRQQEVQMRRNKSK